MSKKHCDGHGIAARYFEWLMSEKLPRSPYDKVKGLVYFPRMLDKIRIHAAGALPEAYVPHLGSGFDGRCLNFLRVKYDDVKARVAAGDSDEAIFDWCMAHGRKLSDEDVETWSGFMQKRGWRDEARERRYPAEGSGDGRPRRGSRDDV